MHERTQRYLKNFFKDVLLEGQPISEVVVSEVEEGTFVQVISTKPHHYHMCLLFPRTWNCLR